MHRVALAATVVCGFCCLMGTFTSAQSVAGINVRILPLKRALFEQTPGAWTLLGPQSWLELEWILTNTSGEPVEIPRPSGALRLRAFVTGSEIPVRTVWATDKAVPSILGDGSTISLRGSTKRTDGSAFPAGDYELRLDVSGLRLSRKLHTHDAPYVGALSPVRVRIVPLDSIQRRREFHMLEGSFYVKRDSSRALREYAALASLPGAPSSDSLLLAELYTRLGRHREACAVFRKILPDIIRAIDGRTDDIAVSLRRRLRIAATSFAVEGDTAMATSLIAIDGRTPADRIPAEVERLRRAAALARPK